jgi:hypothetical protein
MDLLKDPHILQLFLTAPFKPASQRLTKTRNPKSEIRNKFKFREFLNGKNGGTGQAAGESENQPRKSAKGAEQEPQPRGENRQNHGGQNHGARGSGGGEF